MVLLTGAACGDDSTIGPPDGPLGEAFLAMCDVLDRCPLAFGMPLAYRSRDECAAILNFFITCRLTEEDLEDDTTRYGVETVVPEIDENKLEACRAWLSSVSCEEIQLGSEDTPCGQILLFNDEEDDDSVQDLPADIDELCEQDEDCLPELYCAGSWIDKEKGIQYCSVCRPRVGEGEDCSLSQNCQEGLYCRYDGDYDACQEPGANCGHICAKPEAAGFRCYMD